MNLALRRVVHAPFVLNKLRWQTRYDADLISSSDGNALSVWNDLSGNSRTLSQGTASFRPIFKVGIVNGHSVVRFDGADDRFSPIAFDAPQPPLIVLVGQLRSLTAGTAFQPISGGQVVHQINTSDAHILFAGSNLIGPTATTDPFVLLALFNGAASMVQVNSAMVVGNAGTSSSTGMGMGALSGGGNPTPLDAAFAGMIAPLPASRFLRRLHRELRARFGV